MKKDITYYDLVRIVHDKVPSHVSFLLMLKLDFTNNTIFYILSYFLRFNGILILCGNFRLSKKEAKETKSLSRYLQYITSYYIMKEAKITNFIYVIISLVIFVLFCLRILIYFYTIYKIKKKQNLEKIKLSRYQVFMDHLVFLFYPFLLEFLMQIIYSFVFPDTNIFKQDQSKLINILIAIVNILLIIGYNINNYFYLRLINRPYCDREVPIKYRYSERKFWIIFFMQNTTLIQSLEEYLYTDNQFAIYAYCYFCIFGLIFIILFFISLDEFNYNILTNRFVSIMAGFCFFSILMEASVRILGYTIKSDFTLFTFNILKVITSGYFDYLSNNINNNKLFDVAKVELFRVNKTEVTNKGIFDVFLYVFNILKTVKHNSQDISSVNLLNTIFEHQNKCNINNCKCKLLQIIPHGKQYDTNYTLNLIERIGFLIESSFVQLDFSDNYDLTLLLSEHFYLLKENPIMAYSLIQTLLFFNSENLSLEQYLILYETCQKYIESCLDYNYILNNLMKNKGQDSKAQNKLQERLNHDMLTEKNFRNIFIIYEKIIHIQTMMNDYSEIIINLMKKKNLVEESTKIKKNEETGEILWIDFIFLDSKNIEEVIKDLKDETHLNNKIFEEISQLKTSKLPMEFYYKIFTFCETFWEGKIDDKILPTFYSFTNDHNLYSSVINPNIFILLRQRYIDLNNQGLSQYYCIFKYSKGMTISYFSEPLSQTLGYLQSDLIDNNIDILLPNDICRPHNNLVLHYLITQQNRVYKTINNRMFNKRGLSIDSTMNGASLPGIGKNLLIIVNIKIHENDSDFFLFYNQNLELISISNNLFKYFNLDIDLMNKCNINLLSIFGINIDFIKKKILSMMPIINEYKYNLDILTEEIFAKKLFKQLNKFNSIKFKILDELENQNLEENDNSYNLKLLKAQKCLEVIYNNNFVDKIKTPIFYLKKPKSLIINNFNKYINNNDKIDYNDKSYKKLIESFLMFQNFNQVNKTPNAVNTANSIYHFYIKLDILYDVPFISIKFNEEVDSSLINQNMDNVMSRKMGAFNVSVNDNFRNVSYGNSIKGGGENTRTHTNETRNRTATATSAAIKILNFQHKVKLNTTFFEKFIKKIVLLLIICVLLVYIIILIYQLDMIKKCYNIFLAFYYNYIQRDKLVNLHSSICSGYYFYSGLVNYSEYLTIDQYQNFIVESAQDFSSSFHVFYQNYIKYRFSLGKDLSSIYESLNISQVSVNWEEIYKLTNYINEVENIVHIATISSISDSYEKILVDIHNFFNSTYKTLKGDERRLNSEYASILYYLSANMQNSFITFFRKIQKEINDAQTNYSQSSILICTLIEVLGYAVILITLSSCMYFLLKSNKTIYKNISNLFIDYTQEGAYSFKNNHDNYIIIEKLMQLKFLINNFSIKAIDKFNKKISYTSIDLSDDRDQRSIVTLESKPSFNKGKKIFNEKETDKKKLKVKNTIEVNNNITNSSAINSKTQNKLLNTNSVNLISKLNQNKINANDKSKINTSKNSFIQDSSIQNMSVTGNKKTDEDDNDVLTADRVNDKLRIIDVNMIKIFLWIVLVLMVVLLVYAFTKIIVTMKYLQKTKQMFIDYSIVTFEYSMIINYFDNLNLILVNQQLGREDVLNNMQVDVESQFKKSEEVKKKSIQSYPKVYKMFSDLNNGDDVDNLEKVLCQSDKYCLKVFHTKYNIVKNGIDVGLKSVAQVIYSVYKDFLQLKNQIDELKKVQDNFISEDYRQIDMSLNFLLNLVEDRCATAFLEDCDSLIKSFEAIIITFNIFIIVFLSIISLFLTIFIIDKIVTLSSLIEKSSVRLCTTISFIKEKNVGYKMKTSSIL